MRKSSFRQRLWCAALFALALSFLFASPSYSQDSQEVVTKGLFVERFFIDESTRPITARPYVPDGIQKLPPEKRYQAVVEQLRSRGVETLVGSNPADPLTVDEYLSLTHILAGGEPGKPMADQLHLLKSKRALDPNQIGVIRAFQGKVVVTRKEKSHQVKSAEPVLFKDLDETDLDSKLELLFDDGSTLAIGEDTVVKIDEMVYDPKTKRRLISLRLAAGIIQVKAAKNQNSESKFTVRTPTMVAGVRGTEFFVESDCDRSQIPSGNPIDSWELLKQICKGKILVSEGGVLVERDNIPGPGTVVTAGSTLTQTGPPEPSNPQETTTLIAATNVDPQPILLSDATAFVGALGVTTAQQQETEEGTTRQVLIATENFLSGESSEEQSASAERAREALTPENGSPILP